MLLKDFYKILELKSVAENKVSARIELNKDHEIFSGHFPDNPIVPGVCLVQIAKEVLAEYLKKDLTLIEGKNIKFTAVVNPEDNNILNVEHLIKSYEGENIEVDCIIFYGESIFLKLKGIFKAT